MHRRSGRRKVLPPVKPFEAHTNLLMASPMHVDAVIGHIEEYVHEEHEKKTYDEFEMIKVHKERFRENKIRENGKFSIKNVRYVM